MIEETLVFACADDWLVATLARPRDRGRRGVLIVVGGPQYRVGSHRQFLLLARTLAAAGIPCMRFDYRGMGDSTGEPRSFEAIEDDVCCAVDAFVDAARIDEVVIWGLCDAASASALYAHRDMRVTGLVLLNPWVRTGQGEMMPHLKHYYLQHLRNPATWRRLLSGDIAVARAAQALTGTVRNALRTPPPREHAPDALPQRMVEALARFHGRVLLILSGNDLTAQEFLEVSESSPQWRALLADARVTRRSLPDATHTFSRRVWRDKVANWTQAWVTSW